MIRSAASQGPLLPATYDMAWSVVSVIIVGLVVTAVVLLVRFTRRSQRHHEAPIAADAVEHVRRLAHLREAGAITADEYEARKNRILGPV
ncbi:SHOCT domain-containing protein [Georgenia sp. MJ173]|uniref:SHOCT domain-containing protein n=1 Tax=Georgenia sunbinii TaxID=3117728 RepID=UPI002F265F98